MRKNQKRLGASWRWASRMGLLVFIIVMTSGESIVAADSAGGILSARDNSLQTWATYDELEKWAKEKHPDARPLFHYEGQRREMAVLFEGWPTGVRRTHFWVFSRTSGPWRVLLSHNFIEGEQVLAEKRADALVIKTKRGVSLLVLPDE